MKNSQKQERDNHPSKEENANCVVFHGWGGLGDGGVGSADTRAGNEEGRE
jgi:hypothetical protein